MSQFRHLFVLMPLVLSSILVGQENKTAADYVARGDEAYRKQNHHQALEYYQQASKEDSLNYQAHWKIARAYIDLGEILANKKERQKFFRLGVNSARKAIYLDSTHYKGHTILCVGLGREALDAGPKKRVRLSKEIRKEAEKALVCNPNDDTAWHVLGRWHQKIATLSWIEKGFANIFLGGVPKDASLEKAAECFNKAAAIRPEFINHHLQLGLTYEKLKKKDLAIESYQKALALPVIDLEEKQYKKLAQNRLQSLKK